MNNPVILKKMRRSICLFVTVIYLVTSCKEKPFTSLRDAIFLNGTWHFALDSTGSGITEKWYAGLLSDSVKLPGTMDENFKGILNTNRKETMRLSRELVYAGMAWYQKNVIIPENWNGKKIRLIMERTKATRVWIDTIPAGGSNDILTAQIYDLSDKLPPGKHTVTILVNNGIGSVPDGVTGSHAWTEHTQSNWNGIVGKLYLEASGFSRIENVQVYPDIEKNILTVKLKISGSGITDDKTLVILQAKAWNTKKTDIVPERSFPVTLKTGENNLELVYKMGRKPLLWSEFDPALYKLTVTLKNKTEIDNATVDFGMHKFAAQGTRFTINGIKTFLRGKHDACVFPLTGYPPMDVDGWQRVFRISKSYGINFYRFHSWTPPMAAFEAADIEGIYLQPELPFWGALSKERNPDLNAFLLKEGDNILNTYGNHPSFVMFALGNELSGDQDVMKDLVTHFRSVDNRHLMSYGSNNYLGSKGQAGGEDYYAACRVGADTDTTYRTHIRGSFSFADANDGGYINGRYPSTMLSYSDAIAKCTVPAVGTEVGQYQIYPNYDEINKYTGVMKPWNLEAFRERLDENGLAGQAKSFFRASGALSVLCYKADIEMALRTEAFGGFHLLDLQDFPGQGSALVGILDAFMDSKGLITPQEFSQFCNRVVPLVLMKKYTWTNREKFAAKIEVANYSEAEMRSQQVIWELKRSNDEIIDKGSFTCDLNQGELTVVDSLSTDLSKVLRPEKLKLTVTLDGTQYKNSYPVWVYPSDADTNVPEGVIVTHKLDKKALSDLSDGASVLLFPDFPDIQDVSVGGLFTPDYWNWRMFKGISESVHKPVSPGTMSILTDPQQPLLSNFPTEFYTNWQWWPILKNSRPFILDNTPQGYLPLIQVVDNIERNHKLGLVFELAVGKGKLLVCMSDLKSIQDKPEGRQLYSSILQYMKSDKFNPPQTITHEDLISLFSSAVKTKHITGVHNISY
jgi:hypothetical protein